MSDDNNSDGNKPVEGDTYECEGCGMKILVTTGCTCEQGAPFFSCCDQEMVATGRNT